ncbi:hypothetical protein GCM10009733_019510 [Nonomuraea maheshkhaliensis]|uniref:Uncharacterized protein n=1 Tax=Nonomuraea maheshkhaliensis TaxID=419590 RepID=A0ABP4QU51_9ACTN
MKTSAEAGTEISAARNAAITTFPLASPVTSRKTPQPASTVTMPMIVMLTPSAVSPPSAKNTPCTSRTTAMHSTPVYGPTSIAASAPPRRCPLVPAATGKLSICTAKMNAATRPAMGAVLSSSSRRAPRRQTATPAAATAPADTDVAALKKPSGTCTAPS